MSDRNYTLGRGKLFFAPFKTGTSNPRGERYLGNSPEVSYSSEVENLDHYGSDEGIREKDESVPLQTDRMGTFTLDDIDMDNVALFWFGTASKITTAPAPGLTQTLAEVELGVWYQIGQDATNPTGLRNLSAVSASFDPSGTPQPLVAGTDYELEAALGRIRFLPDSAIVTEGGEVEVSFDADGDTRTQVVSGNTPIEGALRYIAYNPAGDDIDYYMPWAKIMPNGDFNLKGDEWQTLPFTLEILKKPGMSAVYVDGRPSAQ